MLGTEESLLDGNWVIHPTGVASTLLRYPIRNHEVQPRVMGGGSEDAYVLPLAYPQVGTDFEATAGMRIPLGTIIWVHSRPPGAGLAKVVDQDGTQLAMLTANTSSAFALVAASDTNPGTWLRVGGAEANAVGPTMPEGPRYEFVLSRNQNNFHVLRAAVDEGYDGTEPAVVVVTLKRHVVIGSTDTAAYSLDFGGDVAIDGVNWDTGTILVWRNEGGIVSGKGGDAGSGGIGGTGASAGTAGQDGGTAVRCPIDVLIYNGAADAPGTVQAGGGGGGGGSTSVSYPGVNGGSGGGGAGATVLENGAVQGGEAGNTYTGTVAATDGQVYLGGAYGQGSTVGANTGGRGGNGGAPGAAGSYSRTLNDGADNQPGGAAGYAFSRAAGATITFAPGAGGIVVGGTIVE